MEKLINQEYEVYRCFILTRNTYLSDRGYTRSAVAVETQDGLRIEVQNEFIRTASARVNGNLFINVTKAREFVDSCHKVRKLRVKNRQGYTW